MGADRGGKKGFWIEQKKPEESLKILIISHQKKTSINYFSQSRRVFLYNKNLYNIFSNTVYSERKNEEVQNKICRF